MEKYSEYYKIIRLIGIIILTASICVFYLTVVNAGNYKDQLFLIIDEKAEKSNPEGDFEKEFKKAETTEQIEMLLKKYPAEGEKIIPKLETTIITEIKSKGIGNRFIIKEIKPRSGPSQKMTLKGQGEVYGVFSEFPGDFILIPLGIGDKLSAGPVEILTDGSIHRVMGRAKFDIGNINAIIGEGDKLNRLTFFLIKDIGYIYLRGKGKVELKNGQEVKLGY